MRLNAHIYLGDTGLPTRIAHYQRVLRNVNLKSLFVFLQNQVYDRSIYQGKGFA